MEEGRICSGCDLTCRLNISNRVNFMGLTITGVIFRSIVRLNHIFVYASRFEGGPCFSLLELLQAGRYVIASPVGGIPDTVFKGEPEIGELVKPGNPILIADAIDRGISQVSATLSTPANIRQVYFKKISGEVAHTQFVEALGIENGLPAKPAF